MPDTGPCVSDAVGWPALTAGIGTASIRPGERLSCGVEAGRSEETCGMDAVFWVVCCGLACILRCSVCPETCVRLDEWTAAAGWVPALG